jgi:K+-sensing histidine kinase KdpD
MRPLLEAAVGRWAARAALGGRSLRLRWRAGEAEVLGDRSLLAQALDNLIVNAIEHGGPDVVVAAAVNGDELRLAVIDRGRRGRRAASRHRHGAGPGARFSGRRRHGHGLKVVRRTATAHEGDFSLHVSAQQTRAVLALPLTAAAAARAASARAVSLEAA